MTKARRLIPKIQNTEAKGNAGRGVGLERSRKEKLDPTLEKRM